MNKDFEGVRRGPAIARIGLSIFFALGSGLALAACGDDDGGDTGAGSTTGSGPDDTTTTSVGQVDSSSSGEPGTSSTGPEVTSSEGTSAGEETSSGGEESTTGEPVEEVFFPEVLAIFQDECFCHRGPMPSGGLDLDDDAAYDSLVNVEAPQAPGVNYVTPGDSGNSYLYLKLTGEQASVGGSGTQMPQGGMLTPEQLDTVRNWIDSGAQP